MILLRHVRVETYIDALGGAIRYRYAGDVVIEATGAEFPLRITVHLPTVTPTAVEPCPGLHGFVGHLRVELVPALMRPAFAAWPPFGRGPHRGAVEEDFDLCLPGVAVQDVGILSGYGVSPGCRRKASSAVPEGPLRATLLGSCPGIGPTVGTGKVICAGGVCGSSFSGPNSSKRSICWVKGCAPNSGLGLPLVGKLNEVCRAGGRTLSVRGVSRLPWQP